MFNIVCAGIDYSTASIEIREKFSFTKAKQEEFYEFLSKNDEILGAVLISTCNRSELCLSLKDGVEINPFELTCEFLGFSEKDYKYKICRGDDVIYYLCMLAAGVKSQIFGEDQIISQIKSSVCKARELDMTDSIIEVLFRTAITSAKKIKTSLNLAKREISIADFVVFEMKKHKIDSVLVIGNGEMGRHMVKTLVSTGKKVFMSVRQYKHKQVEIPEGCTPVEYSEIYDYMEQVDAVISATLSPHYTVKIEEFNKISNKPKYLFDLAIPRDIDVEISNISGISLYDVDSLSPKDSNSRHEEEISEIRTIIRKYIEDFYKWYEFKKNLSIYGDEDEA